MPAARSGGLREQPKTMASNTRCERSSAKPGCDYQATIDAQGATRNAMFGMDNLFQAPRSIRLGIRIDF